MERDFSGSVAVLFGLDGFRLLAAVEIGGEVEILAETTADVTGCPECGAVARAKDRRPVWVRDLPIAGRPVVLCWHNGSGAVHMRCAPERLGPNSIRRSHRVRV
ncbi:transposase family protein [Antrihabitans sp. YC3-6]|uniref:Transposase family protein n=1 Tax=Antrihabitans stalagmiti TaxID=2799499 RepID=A0A934U6V9_9NOCA|nr:transposase family protein [Antrihabitans stalagmiti]MBJ8342931.1 transposase family protein [Antrihabitans stalagmiti]